MINWDVSMLYIPGETMLKLDRINRDYISDVNWARWQYQESLRYIEAKFDAKFANVTGLEP